MSATPLIMTLLVRDEADIVAYNVEHHLSQGVDHVIAMDNASLDGTCEILQEYERAGVLTLIHEPSHAYLQDVWATRMAKLAHERFGPCRLISNDADEFWSAPDGNLKTALTAPDAAMLQCRRKNMITAHDWLDFGDWHSALVFHIEKPVPMPRLKDRINDPMDEPFFYYALPPKYAFLTDGLQAIHRGAHNADYDRPAERESCAVRIFHYPLRDAGEFERSIERIGAAVERTEGLTPGVSWKYRRWHAMAQRQGDVRRALAEALPSSDQLIKDLASGRVIRDRRFALAMAELAPRLPRVQPEAPLRDRQASTLPKSV